MRLAQAKSRARRWWGAVVFELFALGGTKYQGVIIVAKVLVFGTPSANAQDGQRRERLGGQPRSRELRGKPAVHLNHGTADAGHGPDMGGQLLARRDQFFQQGMADHDQPG